MNTLPEEWRTKAGRARKKGGGAVVSGKKRSGASLTSPPAKKKQQECEGKIVITADNPVSCLYEFAKKVSQVRRMMIN